MTDAFETSDCRAKLTWSGPKVEEALRIELLRRLEYAGALVQSRVQRNLSVSGRTSGPSKPGEYPHADTGRLRNSIFYTVVPSEMTVVVGTNLKYGLYLEYGTSGGRVITAGAGKTLSWVGKDGVRRFAKTVRVGPIAPRRFLRRTVEDSAGQLNAVFTKAVPDGKLRT